MPGHEEYYTGAFGCLIKATTMAGLRANVLHVIDLENVTKSPKLPRVARAINDLSSTGATCRLRAILEGERRWCGNTTETILDEPIVMTDRELLATLLDLRTVGAAHLTSAQRARAIELFEKAYVRFAGKYVEFQKAEEQKRVEQAEEQARAAMAESAGKKRAEAGPSSSTPPTEKKPFLEPLVTAGITYGKSAWDDDSDDADEVTQDMMADIPPEQGYLVEARSAFKRWSKLEVDWVYHFPELKKTMIEGEPFNVVDDLMLLDMGVLYRKFGKTDPARHVYGFIPEMAASCYGEVGALNAESYCERVLSGGNLVVTNGNTLLADEEVTMAVLLRINRRFMEHMRANHAEEAKQAFGKTIVNIAAADKLEEDAEEY
jgi:hypothetical protein